MPDILHRFTIDAPPEQVHDLIATEEGVERWWTAHPNVRRRRRRSRSSSAARTPPPSCSSSRTRPSRSSGASSTGRPIGSNTTITFALNRRDDGGTTLLFTHGGWREANEFMHGCSTNWGAYLTSLKSGAERGEFAAYPAGEMSRWG